MQKKSKRETALLISCSLLGLSLFYLILLNIWGLSIYGNDVDYNRFGNWSDAISGIGTTSALIVALASLYAQKAAYKSDENRRLFELETSIFLWLSSKEIRNENNDLIGRMWDLRIHNSTVAPIYHWQVKFDLNSEHFCNFSKRPLLPGENVFNLTFLDNLEPGKVPEAKLYFEGISKRIWERTTRGIIKEMTVEELLCSHRIIANFTNRV